MLSSSDATVGPLRSFEQMAVTYGPSATPCSFFAAVGGSTVSVHTENQVFQPGIAIPAGNTIGLSSQNDRGAVQIYGYLVPASEVRAHAVPAGLGTGTALLDALTRQLCAEGCVRLWLTMTNGNLSALQFYLRRGFRLTAVRPGAVDAARKLKPTIPLFGEHGIPLHDELDLCRILGPAAQEVPVPPQWPQRGFR